MSALHPLPSVLPMDTTRASDADRDRTAEQLRDAVGDGRLSLADADERLLATYAARTVGDLALVTADLGPPVTTTTTKAAAPAPLGRQWAEAWRAWSTVTTIMVAVWAATSLASGELLFFWPMFPAGSWGAVLLMSMLTGQGPGCARARGHVPAIRGGSS